MDRILERIRALDPEAPRRAPTAEAVAAFETAVGTTLQPDYRTFLDRVNGVWLPEVEWDDALDDMGHASAAEIIYGIDTGDRALDQPVAEGSDTDLGFYDTRFSRHGTIIGRDGGDNVIVQVARGREVGAIKWLDHEYWYGGMVRLLGGPDMDNIYEGFDASGWDELTTDELWERAAEYGWARTSAPDLSALFEQILDRQDP